ncbi:methionine biosynthesis protein MetW [Roseibium sp.]|uniref:methionine biosynthesis protein MetW n=1 Tax=Roseibium sp. TaxID=1936156 RepID=UPI003A976653
MTSTDLPFAATTASSTSCQRRALDIGSNDGTLLDLLARERRVDGRGVEISRTA